MSKIKVYDLPEEIYSYLQNFDFKDKKESNYRNLEEELKNFGYEVVDEDNSCGEYCELRAYNEMTIKKVEE